MADKPLPWFRLYSEMITDRKITAIARMTAHSRLEIVGALTTLFALASESPIRGTLLITQDIPYELDDIVDVFELPPPDTREILEAAQRLEILDFIDGAWVVLNWNKRQYKSDDSYDRVTKYRQNTKQTVTSPLQDRYSNDFVTPPEADTEAESDTDTDTEAELKTRALPPSDDFVNMCFLLEKNTGYPIPPTEQNTKAINEFIKLGVIEDDIQDAIDFLGNNGIISRGPHAMLGSIRTAIAKRTQRKKHIPTLEEQGYKRVGE